MVEQYLWVRNFSDWFIFWDLYIADLGGLFGQSNNIVTDPKRLQGVMSNKEDSMIRQGVKRDILHLNPIDRVK